MGLQEPKRLSTLRLVPKWPTFSWRGNPFWNVVLKLYQSNINKSAKLQCHYSFGVCEGSWWSSEAHDHCNFYGHSQGQGDVHGRSRNTRILGDSTLVFGASLDCWKLCNILFWKRIEFRSLENRSIYTFVLRLNECIVLEFSLLQKWKGGQHNFCSRGAFCQIWRDPWTGAPIILINS